MPARTRWLIVTGIFGTFRGVTSLSEPFRLWHVTVTVAGDDVEPLIVRNALRRLNDQRPFLHSLKYSGGRAEIQYWEEAESLLDASSLALRVWNEHRASAGLPRSGSRRTKSSRHCSIARSGIPSRRTRSSAR